MIMDIKYYQQQQDIDIYQIAITATIGMEFFNVNHDMFYAEMDSWGPISGDVNIIWK